MGAEGRDAGVRDATQRARDELLRCTGLGLRHCEILADAFLMGAIREVRDGHARIQMNGLIRLEGDDRRRPFGTGSVLELREADGHWGGVREAMRSSGG